MSDISISEFREKLEKSKELKSELLRDMWELQDENWEEEDCPLNYDGNHESNSKHLGIAEAIGNTCPFCGKKWGYY